MKTLALAGLGCALSLLPVHAAADKMDESRSVAADATVSVSNVAGKISVTTWDRNEIHLTGELGANQELKITENDQGVQIDVDLKEQNGDFDESELSLVIPRGASILADAISADISIQGCECALVSADAVSGDIEVEADAGRVELSSVAGDLDFKGASSRTSVESVSGDIDLEGLSGEISIKTVSGDADLEAGKVSLGRFESVSGTLELELDAEDGARITVESMNGDVTLWLPETQSAEFKAQSFSGDINTDFGQVEQESFGPGSHLEHVSGNNGTTIRVDSFSGDIRIGHK